MTRVAITGAKGYIGGCLSRFLESKNYDVCRLCRQCLPSERASCKCFNLAESSDFEYLVGVDVLVHCAYDFSPITLEDVRRINLEGTLKLFGKAKEFGVRKIILISTNASFDGADSIYGKVKYELERQSSKYGAIIVRPGLVFGVGGKGIVNSLDQITQKVKILPIVGFGRQKFYPCHINDLVGLLETVIRVDLQYDRPIVAASEQIVSLKQVLSILAQYREADRIVVPIPPALIYLGLRFIEMFGLNVGFKSDSFKTMMTRNQQIDFDATRKLGCIFRPFNALTYDDKPC